MFSFDLDTNEVYVYDVVGPSDFGLIGAELVIGALKQMEKKHVTVRLNTPGGDVNEGIAIFNAFKRHRGGVSVVADSLAASMGSYLLQAGEERRVAPNARVMIHDPWTIAIGNSTEMRKAAEVLDNAASAMIPDYAARSGKTDAEILDIMAAESWYTGAEAVTEGFADAIEVYAEAKSIAPAVQGLHRLCSHMPDDLRAIWEANKAARLNDQLLSVGMNRKSMNREDAMRKAAKIKEACAWIK